MKTYHPLTERIVDILITKVNNNTRHSFRILTGYYLSKIASMMRCNIQTADRGVIPVNSYVLNLMVSGSGKGYSTNILERNFVAQFKGEFLNTIFRRKAEENIRDLAIEKATNNCNNQLSILSVDEEIVIQQEKLQKQFDRLGELTFSFDSATVPAVKQMREKLLLAAAGSMNLELDEIGSNISNSIEVLNTFLELYDVGMVKQKLLKNTIDNIRSEEIPGTTPTNLLMFGTPSKLLDGGKTEEFFKELLETGYARRLLFGYETEVVRPEHLTASERYQKMVDKTLSKNILDIQRIFASFAKRAFNPVLTVSKDNSIKLIEYQMKCEQLSDGLKEHMFVQKAEMTHRYYKVLKLAGAYAFADNSPEITSDHLDYATTLVEDSGEAFHSLMRKKGTYERLANYLANTDKEVTQHELLEELPFYKGSESHRRDMMTLATSYGYKNNIIIRRRMLDDIDFFSGETLAKTNMNKLSVSISNDSTHNFATNSPPFDQLYKLTTAQGYYFTVHAFINGHRKSKNLIPGFNLIAFDCNGDVSINAVKLLLEDYTFLISTTKKHTKEINKFTLIIPVSHRINLEASEYSKFMTNVFNWLPFSVDEVAKNSTHTWETHPGIHEYNHGEIVDATMFIPETRRSEEVKASIAIPGVSTMERWFIMHTNTSNRTDHLYRYGMVLIDMGLKLGEIIEKLDHLNNSLEVPLPDEQFRNNTCKEISKQIHIRDNS